MKAEQIKVSPAGSETILKFILEETLQKPFFRDRDTGEIRQLAEKAAPEMPEDYLPDTYLDFDLSGGGKPFLTFLLNSQECNLVNAQTQGRYFAESAVPAVLAPEQYRRVAGLGLVDGKSFPFEADHTLISPREYLYTKNFGTPTDGEAACSGAEKLIERLQAFPVKYEAYHRAGICTVSFDTGKRSPKNRFSRKDCADGLLSVLAEQGVPEETLSGLKDLSRNYAMPFYDTLNGYREWVCCADIAYFSVSFCGEKAAECRVGLLLTDKGMLSRGEGLGGRAAEMRHYAVGYADSHAGRVYAGRGKAAWQTHVCRNGRRPDSAPAVLGSGGGNPPARHPMADDGQSLPPYPGSLYATETARRAAIPDVARRSGTLP